MVDFLDEERKRQKLSMDKLSELSGIPVRTINSWIYKKCVPSVDNLRRALNALGYDLSIVPRRDKVEERKDRIKIELHEKLDELIRSIDSHVD